MGAFDSELYALGYRFNAVVDNQKPALPEFVGPKWKGYCHGDCSASVCYPCEHNNKLGRSELENLFQSYQKRFEYDSKNYPALRLDKQHKAMRFIALHPTFIDWLALENSK